MFDALFKKNLISSLYYKMILLILNFIFISFFVKLSGVEEYGKYIVLLSLVNFFLIFNAGINNTFIKYIGENRENAVKLQIIYSSLMVLSIIYLVIVSLGFFVVYEEIIDFLRLRNISILELILVLSIFILMFLNSNFSAILNAYEKIYISNRAEGILNFSKLILSMLFLYYYGVVGALFGLFFALSISIFYLFIQIKIHTNIKIFCFLGFNIKEIKKMFNFSIFTSGNALIWRIFTSLDKILISKFLGQDAVGFYNIAISIAIRIWEMSSMFSSVSYPKFLSFKKDFISQKKFFNRIHLLNTSLIFIVVLLLFLYSKVLISLWINGNVANNSYKLLNMMLIGVLFGSMNFINSLVLFTYNKHKIVFFNTLAAFLIYIFIIFVNKNNISLDLFAYGFSLYFVISSILNWISVKKTLEKVA